MKNILKNFQFSIHIYENFQFSIRFFIQKPKKRTKRKSLNTQFCHNIYIMLLSLLLNITPFFSTPSTVFFFFFFNNLLVSFSPLKLLQPQALKTLFFSYWFGCNSLLFFLLLHMLDTSPLATSYNCISYTFCMSWRIRIDMKTQVRQQLLFYPQSLCM